MGMGMLRLLSIFGSPDHDWESSIAPFWKWTQFKSIHVMKRRVKGVAEYREMTPEERQDDLERSSW
jgi:hypothetical protein